jgi:predicted ATPase/propanediol dehydratase small subunit
MRLVGRDHELDEVDRRLQARRLVTLIGPGGVGKTALAEEAVSRAAARFELGSRRVDLTRIDDADAVAGALAAQLGFESFQALLDAPGDRKVLLLVDNCEHLLEAAAHTIGRVLEVCEQPTVLATSRSPLELPGESVVALAPLEVPAVGAPDPLAWPAVELFLGRAREAGVRIDGADLDAVADLCGRLDGLPLALEIAAARARTMTPAEIAARLREGADVLDRPRFRGPTRHRSVAETIHWSYDLLGADERDLLEQLAVFAGPFEARAARGMVDLDGDDRRFDALVDELVHASLVVADTSGPSTRYRLLESVRRFALDRLDEHGGRDPAFDRFADRVLQRAREILRDSTTAWRPELVREMVATFDDLAEALRWCTRHDTDPQRAWRLCAAMWAVVHQGHADDVVIVGRQTMQRWPLDGSSLAGAVVATVATAEYVTGDPHRAIALAESTLSSLAAPSLAAVTLRRVLGQARRAVGDVRGALDAFRDGAGVARDLGMPAMALELDVAHAQVSADDGRVEEALQALGASVDESVRIGSVINEAWARSCLGWVRLRVDPAAALAEIDGALEMSRRIEYPIGIAVNLRSRAYAELLLGRVDAARSTIAELLDEVLGGGAISLARLVVDVAAVFAHRLDDPAWAQLASSAAALPTATLVGAGFDLMPLPADRARPLSRRDAVNTVIRLVAAAPPAMDAATEDGVEPSPSLIARGPVWEAGYRGRVVTVRASKGLADLAVLLESPGREHHCLDLTGAGVQEASTGEVIDAAARRAYETRIRDLQEEVDDAELAHDLARAERAQAELDALVDHLTAAIGRGGRTRKASATAERARSAVTQRLRTTMRQLADAHPELGRHLQASINTGLYCSYTPPDDTTWHVVRDPSG